MVARAYLVVLRARGVGFFARKHAYKAASDDFGVADDGDNIWCVYACD